MSRGRWLCSLLYILMILPQLASADAVPVLQLTVQPARLPNHDQFLANTLLRELQRQAVLIAARDELGLATRDMVLREPFAPHGVGGATTVLCSTRIEKNSLALLFLARFDGAQPSDGFALADLQVDQPQNSCQQSISFHIKKDPLVDYPGFIASCEQASRTTYLQGVKDEQVLGNYVPQATRWAEHDDTAAADPQAILRLQHMDVFSQYLAVRRLHEQMRSDGASTARLSALVRGYANLGQLTRGQWSYANKVFAARALLYAQRLAVHDNFNAASLYTRAYACALAGMHAAALDDLASAEKQVGASPPAWAAIIKGLCLYDPQILEESQTFGSWRYRPLASFLAVKVRQDDFPFGQQQDVFTRAEASYPGLWFLSPPENPDPDAVPQQGGEVGSQVRIVMVDALKEAQLPPAIQQNVHLTEAGDKTYQLLRDLREALKSAATQSPRDTGEPSYAVLADLIEQQEMLAIARRVTGGPAGGQQEIKNLLISAHPILKVHPWSPLLDAMALDNSQEGNDLNKTLAKVKDHDPGPWITDVTNDSYHVLNDSNKFVKAWLDAANLSADSLVDDYTADNVAAKTNRRGVESALLAMRQTSPHSAGLLLSWMKTCSADAVLRHPQVYDQTLKLIENQFSDRPSVLLQGCDWCDARGDFNRSLKLLEKVDEVEPSTHTLDRLALVNWRLGKHDDAMTDVIRGAQQSDEDPTEKATLYQRAGYFLIADHRYTEALANVQLAAEVPTPRIWQLMARCYEAMGRLDDAEECLHQQALLDPLTYSQYYLWARRLGRADAKEIQHAAIATFGQPSQSYFTNFFVCMADNQETRALDLLRTNRDQMNDAYQVAQLVILAKKRNNKQVFNNNINALRNLGGDHQSFGIALRALIQSKNLPDGIQAFNAWTNRQLDDEDTGEWYSLAGRYLVAAGHLPEGKVFLTRTILSSVKERENYYLAWRELANLGQNPDKIAAATTQSSVR